jgi:hypothetical protein
LEWKIVEDIINLGEDKIIIRLDKKNIIIDKEWVINIRRE